MTWTTLLLIAALIAVAFLFARTGTISAKSAVAHLKNGAQVIDVRSAGEFTTRHLPNAMNLPLSEIETLIVRKVPDRNKVLLLHCQSGSRSGVAKKMLRELGYVNAFAREPSMRSIPWQVRLPGPDPGSYSAASASLWWCHSYGSYRRTCCQV